MLLMMRSSRARIEGRSRAVRRCLYVRVEGEAQRVSRESWRSFCAWASERGGMFEGCEAGQKSR